MALAIAQHHNLLLRHHRIDRRLIRMFFICLITNILILILYKVNLRCMKNCLSVVILIFRIFKFISLYFFITEQPDFLIQSQHIVINICQLLNGLFIFTILLLWKYIRIILIITLIPLILLYNFIICFYLIFLIIYILYGIDFLFFIYNFFIFF